LNDDSSIIYNYLIVGSISKYMIFFGLQESTGAYTSSVHRSSVTCDGATGMHYKNSKVYGLVN
jgi:hypothetical protein